jgi:hypothetical protein
VITGPPVQTETCSLSKQVAWIEQKLSMTGARNVFVLLNVGETHAPNYYEGASCTPEGNPCMPFQTLDRSTDCRIRQLACIEFVDCCLSSLLDRFREAAIVLCSDHGDCWGEDGLWEHGISRLSCRSSSG